LIEGLSLPPSSSPMLVCLAEETPVIGEMLPRIGSFFSFLSLPFEFRIDCESTENFPSSCLLGSRVHWRVSVPSLVVCCPCLNQLCPEHRRKSLATPRNILPPAAVFPSKREPSFALSLSPSLPWQHHRLIFFRLSHRRQLFPFSFAYDTALSSPAFPNCVHRPPFDYPLFFVRVVFRHRRSLITLFLSGRTLDLTFLWAVTDQTFHTPPCLI